MHEITPDPTKPLQFHEPTTAELHCRIEQLAAQIVLLTARIQQLEENSND